MKKDFCDKCGREINLGHQEGDPNLPCINGGKFQYNLEYSFTGNLNLHGVKEENEFDNAIDLCVLCALEIIQKIENVVSEIEE